MLPTEGNAPVPLPPAQTKPPAHLQHGGCQLIQQLRRCVHDRAGLTASVVVHLKAHRLHADDAWRAGVTRQGGWRHWGRAQQGASDTTLHTAACVSSL